MAETEVMSSMVASETTLLLVDRVMIQSLARVVTTC